MKKYAIKNVCNPKWGLFDVSFWKHPILWLKHLKIYRERIRHLKKYGYSPQAEWETYLWLIDVIKPILKHYRYDRRGTPWVLDEPEGNWTQDQEDRNGSFYNSELDKMLELLDKMDERNCSDSDKMKKASKEFFELFAKYFYGLWD